MRIKEGQWPDTSGLAVKVGDVYREVTEGYTKVDGVWVPWDFGTGDGDQDLSAAISNKSLDGLTLILKVLR